MKTIQLCFLWHMHQPYYTDPVEGSASMPWVRLHAIKAYFDMAHLLERFPTMRATFNFTPSLLVQLQELASGTVKDLFLDYAQKPAADLTQAERAFLVRHFFAANWATMVRPFPRYHELLVKRGTHILGQDLTGLARQFTVQELRDLQVWHNLAWFGYGTVRRYPRLAALRKKDRGFTEEDKQEVLRLQLQTLAEIIPFYRRLAETGQIELTTSPFYHPILPLLIDTDQARRGRPDTSLPQRFQAPADAEAQVQQAVALHRDLFGSAPAGLWPSEGSVCPELIPILRRAGLHWTATDEGILARSLGGWDRARDLYQPYLAGEAGNELTFVFRDREISDAFGFIYSKAAPDSAVEDALRRIAGVIEQAPDEQLLLPIILDGENPWEHYYDGGEQFLSGLYQALDKGTIGQARVTTATLSQALATQPPTRRLDHLHSGSWINADFGIWLGHQEDNRGWDLIKDTRQQLTDVADRLAPDAARGAWNELYAAEGSDWFWWYGDDFETDYKAEFDRLFRTHLRNVFLRAGLPVPDYLSQPLFGLPEPHPSHDPVRLLNPTIDGLVTNFFEWRGAGSIDPAPPLGAMWKSSRLFTYLGFGFSLDRLFLRLDQNDEALAKLAGVALEVQFLTKQQAYKLVFPLDWPAPTAGILWSSGQAGGAGTGLAEVGPCGAACRRNIIELAVPWQALDLRSGDQFRMSLVVTQGGLEIDRYPRHHPLSLTVPDEHYEARMWKV
ncbi:MAG: glycoside hydrolase [Nitrospirota bacterium]|nr:glycoside hydrolase [Nitrospirota bacterium]